MERFTAHFRPHFPILGYISVNNLYHNSPFLFWTIIVVVTSKISEPPEVDLFTPIKDAYMDMLRSEILMAPLPLHKIQALLHLCVWPLPVHAQVDDPSWIYCGIAVNSALYMGLHRQRPTPSLRSVGVSAGSSQARANAWLGCFFASVS